MPVTASPNRTVCNVGEYGGDDCGRSARFIVTVTDGHVYLCDYHAYRMVEYFASIGINAPIRRRNERMTVQEKIRRNAETLNPEFYHAER